MSMKRLIDCSRAHTLVSVAIFSSLNEIEKFNPPVLHPNSVVFIGMASPKQEILAQKILKDRK